MYGWKSWVASSIALFAIALHAPSALGQLSNEDIAALREQGEREGWTFTVGESSATARPLTELCGLVIPKDWWVGARFDPCTPKRDLPSYFNWCEQNGCPPIRDQGYCGSCWAFGTVGPLESNILLKDGVLEDLSEQWLVSCNQDGWGCGGGFWAHDYHQWKTDPCGGTGAVLEEDFPYVASDVPCDCPYPHAYLLDGWAYIGDGEGVPPVDAIKQAILMYGPVSAAMCANDAFHAYTGGIFNACDNWLPNHAVVLVGWDDNQGGGVWFLRNSWGPGWGEPVVPGGEGGYMRITYNCSNIGYAACFVDYGGPFAAPDLIVESSDVSPTTDVNPGDPIALSDVVKNQGENPAESRFWVSWYISTDADVTTEDFLWPSAWHYVPYLAPGETSAASYTAPWPDVYPYNCPGKTYYIAVMADDENDIFETDEGNNWGQVWEVTLAGTNQPPVLSNYDGWPDGVDPDEGDTQTTFTFRVHYVDPEGTDPVLAQIVIDEQVYDMAGGGNESDYELELTGSALGGGTHNYYFYFEDGCFAGATLPEPSEPWQFYVVGPPAGLIAYWPFDEGSGSVAHDYVGGFDGTLYPGTEWCSGVSGSALEFVDHGMVWQIPEAFDDTVVTTQALTLALWVYRYSNVPERSGLVFDGRAQGADAGFKMTMEPDGHLTFFVICGWNCFQRIDSVSAVSPDQWTHLAAEFDYAAGVLRLFINGEEDAASPAPVTEPYRDDYSNAAIGNNHWAPGDGQWRPFYGMIDEVRLYNGALTAQEICELYVQDVPCFADLTGDNSVDLEDLGVLLAHYGETGGMTYHEGDLDCDEDVDLSDLGALLSKYGTTCD